ncbi:MAG: hypothetical protein AB7F65_03350 [Dehalococcoidia bacterium]
MTLFEGWFAPIPWSDRTATRSGLVIMSNARAAVATTLILQEMGLSVDVGAEPEYALRWLQQARYDVVVAGGPGVGVASYAARLRDAAPTSRVVIVPEPEMDPDDAVQLQVEILEPPVDVNQLVACFPE